MKAIVTINGVELVVTYDYDTDGGGRTELVITEIYSSSNLVDLIDHKLIQL